MTRVSLAGGRVTEQADQESVHRISQDPMRTWERWWLWGSERLNPILVKEVRQSLKSRQFEISFGLTLLAAVGWTLLFMSFAVPRILFIPSGGIELLNGYAIILLVPLLIIIPFSAYRSLTTEVEESTFELLSITSLSAKQIVTGKMATAALQILLYVSALTPCIVLTYMLRGVSLGAILMILGTTIVYSVMLVSCALMVATVSRTRAGQSGMSVLLLALLVISFFAAMTFIVNGELSELVADVVPRDFAIGIFAFVTIFVVTFSLLMQVAAAAIDFPSENKSTPIRKRILVLLGVCLFWLSLLMVAQSENIRREMTEICSGLLIGFFTIWMAVGGLICGERGLISPRARRSLPESFLGRVLMTWLSPGAGLGYVYLMVVFISVVGFLAGLISYVAPTGGMNLSLDEFLALGYVLTCYLAFYVGLCRLLMLMIGRNVAAPMVISFSLLIVLNIVLQVTPYFVASYFNDFNEVGFEWHQAFNVYLAVKGILTSGWGIFLGNLIVISLAAMTVFGLNLMLSTRDVMILRISAPERVLRETVQAAPANLTAVDPFQID